MPRQHLFAIIFLALGLVSTGAIAQTVYRCGDAYSQQPCPGGVAVDANDSRTPAQQAQARKVAAQDAARADALQAQRLKEEKLAASPSKVAQAKPASQKKATNPAETAATPKGKEKKGTKAHKNAPEYFTAKVPAEPKKDAAGKAAQ
jgi:hypothetical protein